MKSSMLVSIASPPMIRAFLLALSEPDSNIIVQALGRAQGTMPGEAAQILSAAFASLQELEVVTEQPMPQGDPGPYVAERDPLPPLEDKSVFVPENTTSEGASNGAGTSNAGAGAGENPPPPPPPEDPAPIPQDPAPEVMTTSNAQIPPFEDPAKPADPQG